MPSNNKNYSKERIQKRKEEKAEDPELPKYHDRAKERRDDQNPDLSQLNWLFMQLLAVDIKSADAEKLSIEKSRYLGGDVEHTHLVKGLDYALPNKVRSEIDKKQDVEDDDAGKSSFSA